MKPPLNFSVLIPKRCEQARLAQKATCGSQGCTEVKLCRVQGTDHFLLQTLAWLTAPALRTGAPTAAASRLAASHQGP